MGVAWTLARAGARHRRRALLGLALVIGAGGGVAFGAFEVAARTQDAYPSYLERADVGELVVNPSLATDRAAELIATTPGVRSVATDDLLNAGLDPGRPVTQGEIDSVSMQVRMSTDERYLEVDRPVVEEGRLPGAGREVFLNRDAAAELRAGVGDDVDLLFFVPSFNVPGLSPAPDEIVEPLGRVTARVVGIGSLATDVLPDELYPRSVMIVTPEVGERFTCTFRPISTDAGLSIEGHLRETFPPDCSMSYRYFSLQIDGGREEVARVTDELTARFNAENETLPAVLRENDVGYIIIPTSMIDARDRVADSLRPAITALRAFGAVALAATVVLALAAALRLARREQAAQQTWRHLGVARAQRVLALAAPVVVAAIVGVALAAAIGFLASGLGAVGSARVLEPERRFTASAPVFGGVAGGLAAAAVLGAAAIAWAATSSRSRTTGTSRPSPLLRAARALHPARGLGVRAAATGSGSGTVLGGSVVAVVAVVASLVFASSVNGLVDEPRRYGWPYDVTFVIGYGYGGAEPEAISSSLDRPEVERWGLAALGSVTIEGRTIASVAELDRFAGLPMPVIEGTRPRGAGEIALGRETAAQLGLDVGDRTTVVSQYGEVRARVTGLVVLPPVGPYGSDRAETGTGVLLSERLIRELMTEAEEAQGLEPGSIAAFGPGSFLAIDLAAGTDVDAFLDSIDDDERRTWDRNGFASFVYPKAVRPPAIADVSDMRRIPLGLGGVFALAMAIGLAIGIAVATRARRRELGVLGALGCSPRELGASVRWHAFTVTAIAAVVGVPLGVAAGRVLYRAFAADLGVVPTVVAPPLLIAGVVVATVVIGLVVSAAPARTVARHDLALALRDT